MFCFVLVVPIAQGCASSNSLSAQFGNYSDEEIIRTQFTEVNGRTSTEMISAAETAYFSGDWTSAISLYQKISKSSELNADSWLRFGNALTQTGRYADALAAYNSSLGLDLEQHKAWFNQSTAYLLLARQSVIKSLQNAGYDDPVSRQMETRLNDLHVMLK